MKWTLFEQAMALQLPSFAAEHSKSCPLGTGRGPWGCIAVQQAVEVFIYIVLFFTEDMHTPSMLYSQWLRNSCTQFLWLHEAD